MNRRQSQSQSKTKPFPSPVPIDPDISCVVAVGEGGRGFVVGHGATNYVITAAHCLPLREDGSLRLPPPHALSYTGDRTFKVLGTFERRNAIYAECLFLNPVADIAVLSAPDGQVLPEDEEAYS